MPSPTSRTLPVTLAWMPSWYCSISADSTETISSALNFMTASRYDLFTDQFKLRAHGAVVLPIAGLKDDAAEDIRINAAADRRLQVQGVAHRLGDHGLLVGRQRHGRDHLHAHP